jgi:hypothetical protein
MAEIRHDFRVDVTAALPPGVADGPVEIAATLIADPKAVGDHPEVVIGIPGGTYHRRYWDLRPPGRTGYSQAVTTGRALAEAALREPMRAIGWQLGATALWLQLGIASAEARAIAEGAGLLYVEDRCMLIEQRRLRLEAPGR